MGVGSLTLAHNGWVFAKVACRYFQFSTNVHSHFCKYLVIGSAVDLLET